jgi:hypothetical protein
MNSRSRSSSSGGALGEHRGESAHRRPDRRGADREQGDQVKPFREQIADRIGGAPQRPRRSRARAVAHPIPPNPPARERRDALTIRILAWMSGPRQSLGVFRHSSSRSRGDVGRVGRAGRRRPAAYGRAPGASRHCAAAAGHRHLAHRRHGGATDDRCRPRRRRRAAPRCPKNVGSRVTGSLVPRTRRRHPRPGSTLVVLVVAAPPGSHVRRHRDSLLWLFFDTMAGCWS